MVTVARFSHWFFTAMAGNKAGKKNQSSSTYFCFYASPIMALGGARYFVQRNTILSLTLPEKFGAKSQSLAGERAKELWFSFVTICYDFGQFKTLSVNIYCSRALWGWASGHFSHWLAVSVEKLKMMTKFINISCLRLSIKTKNQNFTYLQETSHFDLKRSLDGFI